MRGGTPGVALGGQAVDHRAAGVGESHHLGALVERLARRVVDRRAEDAHVARRIHAHDLGVAAAHQQAQEREAGVGHGAVRQVDEVREDVAPQVIDLDQGDVVRERARPLVNDTPTMSDPSNPGPRVNAMASSLFGAIPASRSAVSTTGMMFCWWPATPKLGDHAAVLHMCTACEAMTFDSSTLLRAVPPPRCRRTTIRCPGL